MAQAKIQPINAVLPDFIELGVPIPDGNYIGRGKGYSEKFRALVKAPIGASIFFPASTNYNTIRGLSQRFQDCQFRIRKEAGGFRVWKTADRS